jgi:nucleoid-associated protein YgaU
MGRYKSSNYPVDTYEDYLYVKNKSEELVQNIYKLGRNKDYQKQKEAIDDYLLFYEDNVKRYQYTEGQDPTAVHNETTNPEELKMFHSSIQFNFPDGSSKQFPNVHFQDNERSTPEIEAHVKEFNKRQQFSADSISNVYAQRRLPLLAKVDSKHRKLVSSIQDLIKNNKSLIEKYVRLNDVMDRPIATEDLYKHPTAVVNILKNRTTGFFNSRSNEDAKLKQLYDSFDELASVGEEVSTFNKDYTDGINELSDRIWRVPYKTALHTNIPVSDGLDRTITDQYFGNPYEQIGTRDNRQTHAIPISRMTINTNVLGIVPAILPSYKNTFTKKSTPIKRESPVTQVADAIDESRKEAVAKRKAATPTIEDNIYTLRNNANTDDGWLYAQDGTKLDNLSPELMQTAREKYTLPDTAEHYDRRLIPVKTGSLHKDWDTYKLQYKHKGVYYGDEQPPTINRTGGRIGAFGIPDGRTGGNSSNGVVSSLLEHTHPLLYKIIMGSKEYVPDSPIYEKFPTINGKPASISRHFDMVALKRKGMLPDVDNINNTELDRQVVLAYEPTYRGVSDMFAKGEPIPDSHAIMDSIDVNVARSLVDRVNSKEANMNIKNFGKSSAQLEAATKHALRAKVSYGTEKYKSMNGHSTEGISTTNGFYMPFGNRIWVKDLFRGKRNDSKTASTLRHEREHSITDHLGTDNKLHSTFSKMYPNRDIYDYAKQEKLNSDDEEYNEYVNSEEEILSRLSQYRRANKEFPGQAKLWRESFKLNGYSDDYFNFLDKDVYRTGGIIGRRLTDGGDTTPYDTEHVVSPGETLGGIAKQYYGSATKYIDIAKANNIVNPSIVYQNQKLKILGATNRTNPIPTMNNTSSVGKEYIIKNGDTLSQIAKDTYGDPLKYVDIVRYNNILNDRGLKAGDKIILPDLQQSIQSGSVSQPIQQPTSRSIPEETQEVVQGDAMSRLNANPQYANSPAGKRAALARRLNQERIDREESEYAKLNNIINEDIDRYANEELPIVEAQQKVEEAQKKAQELKNSKIIRTAYNADIEEAIKNINDPDFGAVDAEGYQDYSYLKAVDANLNNTLSDFDKIRHFHSTNDRVKDKTYLVDDKQNNLIHIMKGGEILQSIKAVHGKNAKTSDEDTVTITDSRGHLVEAKGNMSTPAGAFIVVPAAFKYNGVKQGLYMRQTVAGRVNNQIDGSASAIHHVSNSRNYSNGCIGLTVSNLAILKKYMGADEMMLYALPVNDKSKFYFRNGELGFESNLYAKRLNKQGVPYGEEKKALADYNPVVVGQNIKIVDKHMQDPVANSKRLDIPIEQGQVDNAKSFLKGLEDNKERLQREFGINGDTYNDIAKLAYGIAGVESSWGKRNSYMRNIGQDIAKKVTHGKKAGSDMYHESENKTAKLFAALSNAAIMSMEGGVYGMGNPSALIKEEDIGTPSSFGMTQINPKQMHTLGKGLFEKYGITKENLIDPEVAALATMIRMLDSYVEHGSNNIDAVLTDWNKAGYYKDKVLKYAEGINIRQRNKGATVGVRRNMLVRDDKGNVIKDEEGNNIIKGAEIVVPKANYWTRNKKHNTKGIGVFENQPTVDYKDNSESSMPASEDFTDRMSRYFEHLDEADNKRHAEEEAAIKKEEYENSPEGIEHEELVQQLASYNRFTDPLIQQKIKIWRGESTEKLRKIIESVERNNSRQRRYSTGGIIRRYSNPIRNSILNDLIYN